MCYSKNKIGTHGGALGNTTSGDGPSLTTQREVFSKCDPVRGRIISVHPQGVATEISNHTCMGFYNLRLGCPDCSGVKAVPMNYNTSSQGLLLHVIPHLSIPRHCSTASCQKDIKSPKN